MKKNYIISAHRSNSEKVFYTEGNNGGNFSLGISRAFRFATHKEAKNQIEILKLTWRGLNTFRAEHIPSSLI